MLNPKFKGALFCIDARLSKIWGPVLSLAPAAWVILKICLRPPSRADLILLLLPSALTVAKMAGFES